MDVMYEFAWDMTEGEFFRQAQIWGMSLVSGRVYGFGYSAMDSIEC
jgi:hypothetical protein